MRIVELILGDDELTGIEAISVVENPAIEEDFIALKNEEIKLAEVDKEKRILMGALLVPNKPIYRRKGEEEYYIYFSRDTVEKASQLYLMNGNQSKATLEHQHTINGLTLVESWLVEDEVHDKSRKYGLNVPVGTWMGAVKVNNDEIWNNFVKTGKVKGFSIEGYFADKMERPKEPVNDFADLEEAEASEMLSYIRSIVREDKRLKGGKRRELESYSDYPSGVKNNAKRGLELNKKVGNKCATQVGKVRAQQLAQGRPISLATIKRMHSYLSRAERVYRQKQNDSKACGNISYLLWGGLAALSWSRNKLKELGELEENQEPQIDSTYPGEAGIPISGSTNMEDARKILFPTKDMAEEVAEMIGCSGSHEHKIDTGESYWMPCDTHPTE